MSDIHGSFRSATAVRRKAGDAKVEVILVVGDITNFGTVEEAEKILLEIKGDAGIPVLFVAGNCDPPQLLSYRPRENNLTNLHLRRVTLRAHDFLGIGGSKTTPHRGTWIEFSESDISRMLAELETSGLKSWVLVTHNPPRGVEAAQSGTGLDLGSESIRGFVERYRPLIVCCGHVHEARGISRIGEIPVVNAGPARDGYCALIELHEDKVTPMLDTL